MLPIAVTGLLTIAAISTVLDYRGLPLPVAIVLVVIAVTSFILRYAAFRRRLLPSAATARRLSWPAYG